MIAGIVGVFTLGWAGIRARELADSMRAKITSDIQSAGRDAGPRVTWFTLPGTTSPPIKLRVQQYTIGPAGSRVQVLLQPLLPKPGILSVSRLWRDDAGAHVQVRAHVDFPPDVLPDDPQLRVAWTLSRDDTREAIALASERKLAADVTLAGEDRVPPVTLSCTVSRVLVTGTHE